MEKITEKVDLKIDEESDSFKYVGEDFVFQNGGIVISKKTYLAQLSDEYDRVKHKLHQRDFEFQEPVSQQPPAPADNGDVVMEGENEVEEVGHSESPAAAEKNGSSDSAVGRKKMLERLVGILSWCADTYPSVAYCRSAIAKRIQYGDKKAITTASRVIRTLRRNDLSSPFLCPVKEPVLRIFSDAAFNARKYGGRAGYVLQIADKRWPIEDNRNIVLWSSAAMTRKVDSSALAELRALETTLRETEVSVILARKLFRELYQEEVPVQYLIDANAVVLKLKKAAFKADDTTTPISQFILEKAGLLGGSVEWVNTHQQKADALTKWKGEKYFEPIYAGCDVFDTKPREYPVRGGSTLEK